MTGEPLRAAVAVCVVMTDGRSFESELLPGVVADDLRLRITMARDDALNADKLALPNLPWLPSDFDAARVAEVRTEYRGSSNRSAGPLNS